MVTLLREATLSRNGFFTSEKEYSLNPSPAEPGYTLPLQTV